MSSEGETAIIDDSVDRSLLVPVHDTFASEHPRLARHWISVERTDDRIEPLRCKI